MATIGLKGIWGLEQLDKTGLATWKLSVLLGAGGVLLAILLTPLLQDVSSYPPSIQIHELILATGIMLCLASGFNLAIALAITRSTEQDIQLLTKIDGNIAEESQTLRPNRKIIVFAIIFSVLTYVGLFGGAGWLFSSDPTTSKIVVQGYGVVVFDYFLRPFAGVMAAPTLVAILLQLKTLAQIAKKIEIDLLRLSEYQAISNSLVRVTIAILLLMSISPFFLMYFEGTERGNVLFAVLAPLPLFFVVVLAYLYPVIVLRNRIKIEKEQELKSIYAALTNNSNPPNTSRMQTVIPPQNKSDLLTQQMFVESRWEWPIASHVQKLVLFGLLPPFTWILAAAIENAMF